MLKTIRHHYVMRLFIILLASTIAGGFTGCTSKKKLARQKAASERTAAIDKAKTELTAIINDNGKMSLASKESKVAEIKALNLQDPEVDELILRAEEAITKQKAEMKRLEDEKEKKRKAEESAAVVTEQKYDKIDDYLDAVVNIKSLEMSNQRISETLKFFDSPEVPVLIIIYQEADIKDYDKPTTIKKYLEYLKDQQKNPNKVNDVKYNDNGKITELELLKK
jgi:hypothetical protein